MTFTDLPTETLALIARTTGLDTAVSMYQTSRELRAALADHVTLWEQVMLDAGFAQPYTVVAALQWDHFEAIRDLAVHLSRHLAGCALCQKELEFMKDSDWSMPKCMYSAQDVEKRQINLDPNPVLGAIHFPEEMAVNSKRETGSLYARVGIHDLPAKEPIGLLRHHLPLAFSIPALPMTKTLTMLLSDMMTCDEDGIPEHVTIDILGSEEKPGPLTVVDVLEVYIASLGDGMAGAMCDGLNPFGKGTVDCCPVILPSQTRMMEAMMGFDPDFSDYDSEDIDALEARAMRYQ